jgi:uncharacterized protein
MSEDIGNNGDQTRYVRSDELAPMSGVGKGGWLWPWGVLGLIGFLALTSFFMVLLRPDDNRGVRIREGMAAPAATGPLAEAGPAPAPDGFDVAAPLPADSPLIATPAIISANPDVPNPPAPGQAPEDIRAPALGSAPIAAPVSAKPDSVAPLVGKAPRIAIMVMDLGGDMKATQAAVEQLPGAVDLGFIPYSAAAQMTLAMRAGHRVWIGIPMQPKRYPAIDPGPKTLLLKNSAAQNDAHLRWSLAQAAPGITGMYNIMGSAYTANAEAMAPVLSAAQAKGFAFFDTRADMDTQAAKLARSQKIPAVLNEAYLDADPAKLTTRLDELARRAKTRGVAVGVLGPSVDSVAKLKAWLESPAGKSVELVSPRSVAATVDLQKLQL